MSTFLPVVPPLAALVLFAMWAMTLVIAVGAWRVTLMATRRVPANGFTPGAQHGTQTYWRLNRAHMNAAENLPIFGALVLVGSYLHVQDPAFQFLPSLILYARVAQSLIHIASGSPIAIALRFLAFGVQLIAMLVIAGLDVRAAGMPMPW